MLVYFSGSIFSQKSGLMKKVLRVDASLNESCCRCIVVIIFLKYISSFAELGLFLVCVNLCSRIKIN